MPLPSRSIARSSGDSFRHIRSSFYALAIEAFRKIGNGSPFWYSAREYTAKLSVLTEDLAIRSHGQSLIRIVAALVQDRAGRVLLVRKRGTAKFMQPGGKLQPAEPPLAALERELREELMCSVQPSSPVLLGTFTAPAANEADAVVEAALHRVELIGHVAAAAEIEEILWLHPAPPHLVDLAPLTRDRVLPLALSLFCTQQRSDVTSPSTETQR